ncbi:MAG TPA: hypothetical protein VKX28_03895 [Xanthobacteraceae bacterium]|nr:hypothetical protein [Xanthobacteraceae bacterium]
MRNRFVLAMIAMWPAFACAELPRGCTQKENAELAITSCTEFLDAHPADRHAQSVAYTVRGKALRLLHRDGEAIADFGRAIEADGGWPGPYYERAVALFAAHETAKAIADYTRVLELEPRDGVYVFRAVAYAELNDASHMLADLQKAIDMNPRNTFALDMLAGYYEHHGDRARAAAEYRKILALQPGNKRVLERLKSLEATP